MIKHNGNLGGKNILSTPKLGAKILSLLHFGGCGDPAFSRTSLADLHIARIVQELRFHFSTHLPAAQAESVTIEPYRASPLA